MCGLTGTNVAYWKTVLVTVIYVLFSSFTALFLDQLYKVVALTGALGGSMIEAIIPASMYIFVMVSLIGISSMFAKLTILLNL